MKGFVMADRVYLTGVRSGEKLVGVGKQVLNTVMEVRSPETVAYPPSVRAVEDAMDMTIRDVVLEKEFFSGMTVEEARAWLLEHGTEARDLYLQDVDMEVRFLRVGGTHMLGALNEGDLARLLSGEWISISDVYEMFPRKPGSRARRHTLVFRPGNWALVSADEEEGEAWDGLWVDERGRVHDGALETREGSVVTEGESIAVRMPPGETLALESIFSLYPELKEARDVAREFRWMTPSLLKSMMQKLVRTRAARVSVPRLEEGEIVSKEYRADATLVATFSLLMVHPGSFVPTIQRYVSGAESAMKRMAVTILEDSYLEDASVIASMLAGALTAQRNKGWLPPVELVKIWLDAGLKALRDRRMYDYDWKEEHGEVNTDTPLGASWLLLEEVKSFSTDIKMLGSIAEREGRVRSDVVEGRGWRWVMPAEHALDHHSLGSIAHWMPYTGQPYEEVFKRLWQRVVGINARVSPDLLLEIGRDEETRGMRNAQLMLWLLNTVEKRERRVAKGREKDGMSFSYRLPFSWLAGAVGALEVRTKAGVLLAMLDVRDASNIIIMRKPGRGKQEPLEGEEVRDATEKAWALLRAGVKVGATPPLPGAIVKVSEDGEWTWGGKPWEEMRSLSWVFPVLENEKLCDLVAITTRGDGVQEGALRATTDLLSREGKKVLLRLSTYLGGWVREIRLHKVGREGEGVDYAVVPEDTAVHHILCKLCVLYPAALELQGSVFKVRNRPIIWRINAMVKKVLGSRKSDVVGEWVLGARDTGRKLYQHQKESLDEMIARKARGTIIWIPVGLGKTMIVTEYILWLHREGRLPPYVVYALPPSAVDNTMREMELAGLPYALLDMTAKGKNKVVQPWRVNLVLHDHMRLGGLDEQLREKASSMLWIVDEFHYALNKTKRTSIALDVARLSRMFIAMSGTIVKDTHTEDLIQWLAMVTDFEVTTSNFWVAVGNLISHKVSTGVKVVRRDIEVQMDSETRKRYKELVPATLGGVAAEIRFREAVALSQDAVTDEIISLALKLHREGERAFIVAKDVRHQDAIKERLEAGGMRVWTITKDTPLTLLAGKESPAQKRIDAVVTTIRHATGYTLTALNTMITGVYFSNQATRTQLEGRLNRIGQTKNITIYTLHTGILSYIHQKYESARSLADALKAFAKEAGVDYRRMVTE